MAVVFIGIGSNLGDRLENINRAIFYLRNSRDIRVEKVSSLLESKSYLVPGPDYLNGVIKITTELKPEDLLAVLQKIEKKLGRKRPFKNAPRTIDLDILLYGDKVVEQPNLKIPHPRMSEREFVMKPLLEIEPDIKKIFKPKKKDNI